MRVIAGSVRGHRLRGVRGRRVRPTADRVREGLFSMLQSRVDLDGARVLDLFSGTGALGIEALSRGAGETVFVEQGRAALPVLRANLEACGFGCRAEVRQQPVQRALRELEKAERDFDGVLLDPPYNRGLLASTLEVLAESALLRAGAWIVGEGHVDETPLHGYENLRLTRHRRYGKTCVVLYFREVARAAAES